MKLCEQPIAPGENDVFGDLIGPSQPLHWLASLAPFEHHVAVKCPDDTCTLAVGAWIEISDVELTVDVGLYALKMAHSSDMERNTTVQGALAWAMENELNAVVPAHRRCYGTTVKPLHDRTVDVPCEARVDATIETLSGELPPIAIAEYTTLISEPAVQSLLAEIVPEASLVVSMGPSVARYDLVAVVYHLPNHFVSQFIHHDRAYYHDGMANQGRPVDVGSSIDVGYGMRMNGPGCTLAMAVYAQQDMYSAKATEGGAAGATAHGAAADGQGGGE